MAFFQAYIVACFVWLGVFLSLLRFHGNAESAFGWSMLPAGITFVALLLWRYHA